MTVPGEGPKVRRLGSRHHVPPLGEHLSMWANTQPAGGIVLTGIDNDGRIRGCAHVGIEHVNEIESVGRLCPDAKGAYRRVIRYDGVKGKVQSQPGKAYLTECLSAICCQLSCYNGLKSLHYHRLSSNDVAKISSGCPPINNKRSRHVAGSKRMSTCRETALTMLTDDDSLTVLCPRLPQQDAAAGRLAEGTPDLRLRPLPGGAAL